MDVRWASPFDISSIAAMLVVMHKEAEFELGKINSEKLMSNINELIHRGIVLVAVEDDLWFYVSPDSRSSKVAISLVKMFIEEIKSISPEIKIRLGHIFSGDCGRKDNFFERLGFKKAGSVFVEA